MERRKFQDQSLGICHRLFNFIMKSLLAPTIKRIVHIRPQGSPATTATNPMSGPITMVHLNGANSNQFMQPEEFGPLLANTEVDQDKLLDNLGLSDPSLIASADDQAIVGSRWIPVEDDDLSTLDPFTTISADDDDGGGYEAVVREKVDSKLIPDGSSEEEGVDKVSPDEYKDGYFSEFVFSEFIKSTKEKITKARREE